MTKTQLVESKIDKSLHTKRAGIKKKSKKTIQETNMMLILITNFMIDVAIMIETHNIIRVETISQETTIQNQGMMVTTARTMTIIKGMTMTMIGIIQTATQELKNSGLMMNKQDIRKITLNILDLMMT